MFPSVTDIKWKKKKNYDRSYFPLKFTDSLWFFHLHLIIRLQKLRLKLSRRPLTPSTLTEQ